LEFNSTIEWDDGDYITIEKLQSMVNNDNYLYRRVVKWGFRGLETVPIEDTTNLKILSGITSMGGEDKQTITADVSFGDFFSASCEPVVTASLATSDRIRVDVTLMGLDGTNRISRNGMRIWLAHQILPAVDGEPQTLGFAREQKVHWQAVGW
jgi:hypothetical protein